MEMLRNEVIAGDLLPLNFPCGRSPQSRLHRSPAGSPAGPDYGGGIGCGPRVSAARGGIVCFSEVFLVVPSLQDVRFGVDDRGGYTTIGLVNDRRWSWPTSPR